MSRDFLNAEWRKLAIVNYAVEPERLQPFVPVGTTLDLWQDTCYISLVGFMFLDTRMLGLRIPFHVNFEEVNLRYYVRRETTFAEVRRGVSFIRELVPRSAITAVANLVYGEHYRTVPMRNRWENMNSHLSVHYAWKCGRWHEMSLVADPAPVEMANGSEAEFITEHYWGYTRLNPHRTSEYQVSHPRWKVYPVRTWDIRVDFGLSYGPKWRFLNALEPVSVMLAEGSEIAVKSREVLHIP